MWITGASGRERTDMGGFNFVRAEYTTTLQTHSPILLILFFFCIINIHYPWGKLWLLIKCRPCWRRSTLLDTIRQGAWIFRPRLFAFFSSTLLQGLALPPSAASIAAKLSAKLSWTEWKLSMAPLFCKLIRPWNTLQLETR